MKLKFLLDSALVLDADGNLLAQTADLFGGFGRDRGRSIIMQFMDIPSQDFNATGWINRIRLRHWNQPGEGYQLAYRKRTPVLVPVNHSTIQAALDQINDEIFEDWGKTIDWSYDSAVLTLSYTINTGGRVPNELPDEGTSQRILRIEVMSLPTEDWTGIEYIVEASFEFENEGRLEIISQHRD